LSQRRGEGGGRCSLASGLLKCSKEQVIHGQKKDGPFTPGESGKRTLNQKEEGKKIQNGWAITISGSAKNRPLREKGKDPRKPPTFIKKTPTRRLS